MTNRIGEHEDWVRSVCVLPGAGGGAPRIVSGSGDKTVRVWREQEEGVWKWELAGEHENGVNSVCVLPGTGGGAPRIVSGSWDKTVRVWREQEEGVWKWELAGEHEDWVRSVCVLPGAGGGAPRIVSGSRDGTVRVWREEQRKGWEEQICLQLDSSVSSFASYEHYILIAQDNQTVRVWLPDEDPEGQHMLWIKVPASIESVIWNVDPQTGTLHKPEIIAGTSRGLATFTIGDLPF
ncbi:hypothetical protein [Gimesia chilikensis]|uniref:hypothetical protein n=1 Tax=Gimesia chilikensis TaxID=2605989 RepID=UPI001E55D938|nr:hypothetical protein [Gimesia chilikensis]